jgi:hypothetical protein
MFSGSELLPNYRYLSNELVQFVAPFRIKQIAAFSVWR